MVTHKVHTDKFQFYFITTTCYQWLPLIKISDAYHYFKILFHHLAKKGILVNAFVIMPNHFHLIVFVSKQNAKINLAISELKRFLAYKIIKALTVKGEKQLLSQLQTGVAINEFNKGKKHQVFIPSFDGKQLESIEQLYKVFDYIHLNPVSGKWNLADTFLDYKYSSARFYELREPCEFPIHDYRMFV